MIAFSYLVILLALLCAYALFLHRVAQGLEHLSGSAEADARAFSSRTELLPSLAVIVPMRNEAIHVRACVESLARQEYPEERIRFILVDDQSKDGTFEVARAAAGDDRRFVVLRADAASPGGKKRAIATAIASSESEAILTTDADCAHPSRWAAAMAHTLSSGHDIVAGPVLYDHRSGVFARLQALEFLGIMGVGAGLFGVGHPRLCNGANLCYTRHAYTAAGGHAANLHLASGDDEFLLHSIVYEQGGSSVFTSLPDAAVRCPASPALGAFLSQRARWASKGSVYEDGRFVAFLVLLFFFFLFSAASPLLILLSPWAAAVAGFLYLLKMILDTTVLFPAARLFGEPVRGIDLVIAEALHPFYLVAVSIAGTAGSFTWKGRRSK